MSLKVPISNSNIIEHSDDEDQDQKERQYKPVKNHRNKPQSKPYQESVKKPVSKKGMLKDFNSFKDTMREDQKEKTNDVAWADTRSEDVKDQPAETLEAQHPHPPANDQSGARNDTQMSRGRATVREDAIRPNRGRASRGDRGRGMGDRGRGRGRGDRGRGDRGRDDRGRGERGRGVPRGRGTRKDREHEREHRISHPGSTPEIHKEKHDESKNGGHNSAMKGKSCYDLTPAQIEQKKKLKEGRANQTKKKGGHHDHKARANQKYGT